MADKPYLAAAFFCEKVLEQKDDVISVIRIVDTFWVTIPPNMPSDVKPAIQITGLLSFKKATPGQEAEKHEVRMKMVSPSGKAPPVVSREINFKPGEIAGHNLIIGFNLGVEEFGLFQLQVSVDDDEIITRVPFRVLEAVSPQTTIH